MTIHGTRVPETAGRSRGAPPSVRYDTQHPWPGIDASDPATWCALCPRAYGPGGRYQVKYVNVMCRDEHTGGSR